MQYLDLEKRACIKFVLTILGLLLLIFVSVRYLGSKTAMYSRGFNYQILQYQQEVLAEPNAAQNRKDIVVLGDSTAARNLIFSKKYNVVSLPAFGGSLVDGYYQFSQYSRLHPPPKCVVIMTSYGAFDYHAQEFFWSIFVKNRIYSVKQLIELYQIGREQNDFPGTISPIEYGYKVISSYDWLNGFDWNIVQSYFFSSNLNLGAYWYTKQNGGAVPLGWEVATRHGLAFSTPAEEYLNQDFYSRKMLDIYIQKLFKKLEDLKIKTVILYPPAANSLRNNKSEKWVQDYKNHMDNLIGTSSYIENHIEAQWKDNGNYFDGTHLLNFAAWNYTLSNDSLFESCHSQ